MGKLTTTDLYAENFKYHIRGGLRGINLDANNDLTNSLFSFKLTYEDDGTYYNGNIRNQYWKSNLDGIQRAYQYSYDAASRILEATYAGKAGESYALENMAYDLNGNITSLWRKGMTQNNTFDYIDKLGYSYGANSNKINSVGDAVSGNLDTGDFRDGNTLGNDYDYWLDGSLKKDLNKGISSIEYNYLKLPRKVTYSNGNTLENQYDATGKKLKSISSDGVTYDFVGNTIYKNNVLYQISHDEGRIVNEQYEYDIKDHLGNLRVSFRDSLGIAKISTKLDYDPWGLTLKGLTYTNPTLNKNNFQFGLKEKIENFGLNWIDFGARIYMPDVPHFITIDPLAEKNHFESGYAYVHGSPLKYFDPDGKDGVLIVFPDYKIATPAGKVGGLGHAGILLIDNKTGGTKYYEYGRYDSKGLGEVRNRSVSNVKIGKDGKPTTASLNKVLEQISKKSGHGTKIEGAYVESSNFEAMKSYAEGKMAENTDPNRETYSLTSNNCGTFACDVLNQDPNVKDKSPSISDPRPNSIIEEYRGTFGKVEYNPKTGGSVETVDKSRYQEILNKFKAYLNKN